MSEFLALSASTAFGTAPRTTINSPFLTFASVLPIITGFIVACGLAVEANHTGQDIIPHIFGFLHDFTEGGAEVRW